MEVEPLWRSRLRWRWRGALLWPAFAVLTLADALLLTVLPIAGDRGTPFVGGLLLAMTFNLILVAVVAPLLAIVLRRRRPDLPRPYRTAGYPLIPAIFLVGTVAMMVNSLIERPSATLLGAGIVAAGVPIYFAWRAAARRTVPRPAS